MTGKVVIVGAGPGDPELITVKGLRMLRSADVVIYDKLIPEGLLREAKPKAELIYAGKAPGESVLTQEEIHRLMVEKAKIGKLVVRLKGGDPMMLGRGGEEIIALAKAGVDFDVVPGVTSAIAAPTAANIPVTYRGLSSSLIVTTGREDSSKAEEHVDFRKLAKVVDTIVVLMGLGSLEKVCGELREGGLPAETPAAIVKDATTPQQVVIEGTLSDIAGRAREAGLKPPAVLAVGRVVEVRKMLDALRKEEKLVLTFRPEESSDELEILLTRAGYACGNVPAARIIGLAKAVNLDDIYEGGIDYAVFTSQIGVRVLETHLTESGLWERFTSALDKAKVVAIGPKTKEALEVRGVKVDVVPNRYCSSVLAKELASHNLAGSKGILFRSADADHSVEKELKAAGADVRTVATHRLTPSDWLRVAAELIKAGRVRALVFTSSLIAKFVDQELRKAGSLLSDVSKQVPVFSIGPATSRTLVELGVDSLVEATEYTTHGLYEIIVEKLGGSGCG